MEPGMGQDSEAFFQQISPNTLEKLCQVAETEALNQTNDYDDLPLSPIVGYIFSSQDDNKKSESSSSSETDSETEAILTKMNQKLSLMIGREVVPEPNTPRSQFRKRMRRRQNRKLKRTMIIEETNKRSKLKENSAVDINIISVTNENDTCNFHQKYQIGTRKVENNTEQLYPSESKVFKKPSEAFTGFQTAGGKKVVISEEALKKAKGLFSDIDNEFSLDSAGIVKGDCKFRVPEEEFCASHFFNKSKTQKFSGFQTAGGKSVVVSEEALKKARGLFSDIDKEMDFDDDKDKENHKPPEQKIPNIQPSIDAVKYGRVGGESKFKTEEMTQEVLDCIQAFLEDEDDDI